MKLAKPLDVEHWFVCKMLRKHALAAFFFVAGCVLPCMKMMLCEVCLNVLQCRMWP